jgi:hypothetical protein
MTPRQAEIRAAYERLGSLTAVAREFGLDRKTVRESLEASDKHKSAVKDALAVVGYDLDEGERTPQEAWDAHAESFERKVGASISKVDRVLRRSGPFPVFHSTDPHVDDDASALRLIEQDIKAAHALGAVMCHGGDLLNNWPMGGKLAKQWAEQTCTLPEALLRAKHYIDIFKPDVWVDGNHEEMNPYLVNLLAEWIPAATLRDYWRCDFTVKVPGGRDFRVALAHKFQKGSSWFHQMHGHLREMLESQERDLYIDGHYHIAGVMRHFLPERNHTSLLVASSGYKLVDKWGTRISRGGKMPRLSGRAHWIVVDPFAEGPMCHAFDDPRHAEVMLNGLQNLREV